MLARIRPGKQRRASAADVQIAGGAGSKTGANGHGAKPKMKARILRQLARYATNN